MKTVFHDFDEVCKKSPKCGDRLVEFLNPLLQPEDLRNKIKETSFGSDIVFSINERATIQQAKVILEKLNKLLKKKSRLQKKGDYEGYKEMMAKACDLNNEYFELIPREEFAYDKMELILDEHASDRAMRNLDSIIDLDISLKLAYGAYQNAPQKNPYDYVSKALPCSMNLLGENDKTYKLIHHYINSDSGSDSSYFIKNVFEIGHNHSAQSEKKFQSTANHQMLWHGTPNQNIFSILKNGLRVKPGNASQHGSMFGEGIYFADQFSKSQVYSYGDNEHQYLLLCEVALGKMHNTLVFNDSKINPKELKIDSIRGMGRQGPDLSQSVIKDGALWHIGNEITYPEPFFAGHNPDDFTSV